MHKALAVQRPLGISTSLREDGLGFGRKAAVHLYCRKLVNLMAGGLFIFILFSARFMVRFWIRGYACSSKRRHSRAWLSPGR